MHDTVLGSSPGLKFGLRRTIVLGRHARRWRNASPGLTTGRNLFQPASRRNWFSLDVVFPGSDDNELEFIEFSKLKAYRNHQKHFSISRTVVYWFT